MAVLTGIGSAFGGKGSRALETFRKVLEGDETPMVSPDLRERIVSANRGNQ